MFSIVRCKSIYGICPKKRLDKLELSWTFDKDGRSIFPSVVIVWPPVPRAQSVHRSSLTLPNRFIFYLCSNRGELLPHDELEVLDQAKNTLTSSGGRAFFNKLSRSSKVGTCRNSSQILRKTRSRHSSGHLLHPSGNSTKLVRKGLCFKGFYLKLKAHAKASRPTMVRRLVAKEWHCVAYLSHLRNIACQNHCLWQNWLNKQN